MPKHKVKKIEIEDELDVLVGEIKNAESEIKSAVKKPKVKQTVENNKLPTELESTSESISLVENKRAELIRLSEDGEIDQSVKHLQKASVKIIEKIYKKMEVKRMEKANIFLTDLLISKLSDVLGGLNAIESSEVLDKELQKDKLLKNDVEKVVAMITPYIPALGIVSGGITIGKHIFKHSIKPESTSNLQEAVPATEPKCTPDGTIVEQSIDERI